MIGFIRQVIQVRIISKPWTIGRFFFILRQRQHFHRITIQYFRIPGIGQGFWIRRRIVERMMAENMTEFAGNDERKVEIAYFEIVGKTHRIGSYFRPHIQHIIQRLSGWPTVWKSIKSVCIFTLYHRLPIRRFLRTHIAEARIFVCRSYEKSVIYWKWA